MTQGANSIYHGFQLFLHKRYSNNFSYQVAYSLSKLIGVTNLGCCTNNEGVRISDPENINYDRGLASFDRTHILTINGIYRFSDLRGKTPLIRGLFGSWELTGIYSYSSGVPLTVTISGADLVGSGSGAFSNRPDLVANPKGPGTADQWLNPNAYLLPVDLGRLGRSPRGSIRSPAINNFDIAIYKNFPIKESMAVQFRAEFYNAFNNTQFLSVDTTYQVGGLQIDPVANKFVGCSTLPGNRFPNCNINPKFGQVTRARDPREIQFALKFIW